MKYGSKRPTKRHNRIAAVMTHTTRYSTDGITRLAADAGITRSVLSKLLLGQSEPVYWAVARVTAALEKALQRALDPRELVSETGRYPTSFVCNLCGCRGCLPAESFNESGGLRESYWRVRPGRWSGDIHEQGSEKWEVIKEVND